MGRHRPGNSEGSRGFPDRRQGEPLVTPGLEIALVADWQPFTAAFVIPSDGKPTRQAKEEKLKMIPPGRVGVGPQFSEKFCRGGGYAFYERPGRCRGSGCRHCAGPHRLREGGQGDRKSVV